MKKIIIIILFTFRIFYIFPQSDEKINSNFNFSNFENRKQSGYYNVTQISIIMGNRSLSEQSNGYFNDDAEFQISPSLTMINGGMIDEHWGLGIGCGFEIFDRNLFPVFADIRCLVNDNDVSPFFAVKMGYSFSGFKEKHYDLLSLNHAPYWANNVYFKKYGGFMFSPEIGVKIPITQKSDLMITAAYRFQIIKSVVSEKFGSHRKWEYKASMNRLAFGLAFMFR